MAELQRQEINARIAQARKEAGLTQEEIADLLDVKARTYQNYESIERGRVPWDLMSRISDITGRSLRWLLHGEDDAEPSMQVMLQLAAMERKLDELLARDTPADAITDLADAVDPPSPDDESDMPPA